MFNNIIPKIFYDQLSDGLEFFVEGLGFEVLYQDVTMAVIARDGAKLYLVERAEYAAKDRPELAIETSDIASIFNEMSTRVPQLLHPNSSRVALKPWGAQEFAMLDKTTVCVIFRQWQAGP